MKSKLTICILLFSLIITTGFSQEKSKRELRKEQKEKEKIENEKRTETLIEDKAFVFVATRALPSGMKSIELSGDNYFVKFETEMIESVMPFFGRAYSGVGYGGGDGMNFKGEPKTFTINKTKKNYQIDVVVVGKNDTYNISLTVSFQGSASLFITSNNRSSISYQGQLEPIKMETEKE